MKRVKLNHYSPKVLKSVYTYQKKIYKIQVDHKEILFSDKKLIKRFIADCHRLLNQCCHDINQVYIAVFSEYRNTWFSFNLDNYELERQITNAFQNTHNSLNHAIMRSSWSNGNTFTFKHINTCLDSLKEAASLLGDFRRSLGKDYSTIRRITSITNYLNYIQTGVRGFVDNLPPTPIKTRNDYDRMISDTLDV